MLTWMTVNFKCFLVWLLLNDDNIILICLKGLLPFKFKKYHMLVFGNARNTFFTIPIFSLFLEIFPWNIFKKIVPNTFSVIVPIFNGNENKKQWNQIDP